MSSRIWLLLTLVVATGCESKPSAPVLSDAPVYQNDQAGFRFRVPDGWLQTASTYLPPGELESERFVVRYQMRSPEQGANLQVLAINDAPGLDLAEHHAGPSFRVARWKPQTEPEALEIGGADGVRLVYSGQVDKREMTKEIVAFRRDDGRVYSFVGLFWSTDEKARQQIRRAVESIVWRG
ncbi:MAG: hypothetical protein ACF8TS_17680 [Maioricimonas sp. JB049]